MNNFNVFVAERVANRHVIAPATFEHFIEIAPAATIHLFSKVLLHLSGNDVVIRTMAAFVAVSPSDILHELAT